MSRQPVIAIGNFDGVHRGHQALIAAAITQGSAAALTFEPHPKTFFSGDQIFRLTPLPEKLALFRRFKLDGAFVQNFDEALAGMSAQSFVKIVLKDELNAKAVVAGEDFHFGTGREGNPALLQSLCRDHGIGCTIVAPVRMGREIVSSSAIRQALRGGRIETANRQLGYEWFVAGEVIHGEKRGRTLGFPTLNLSLPESCGLKHGIYAVRARWGDELREGVASFGRRPTFDNGAPLLETFLFDYEGDLYGQNVEIAFAAFIRDEERFDSIEALVAQMERDAATAKRVLVKAPSPASG